MIKIYLGLKQWFEASWFLLTSILCRYFCIKLHIMNFYVQQFVRWIWNFFIQRKNGVLLAPYIHLK